MKTINYILVNKSLNIFINVLVICIVSVCLTAYSDESNIKVKPQPKKIKEKNQDVLITDGWHIAVDKENIFYARYFKKGLKDKYSFNLGIKSTDVIKNDKCIIIGEFNDNLIKNILERLKLSIPKLPGRQAYFIDIFEGCNNYGLSGNRK